MSRLAERLNPTPRRAPEASTARSAGKRAAIFLTLAVLAALGAALLFSRYLDRRATAARIPTVKVVVASADIPVATPLRPELLTAVDWPQSTVPAGASALPTALVGKVTRSGILKGEPILAARLASGDVGQGLSAILPASMRAVSVRVDDVVGVAGFIHPGDNVDVIVTMKPSEASEAPPTSKIILQNVKVLAVGKELDRKDKKLEKAVPVTVATLMVTSEDAEKLALASTKGQILLALRSGVDAEQQETPGIIPAVLLQGAPQAPAKPTAAPAATASSAASSGSRPARTPTRHVRKPATDPAGGHQIEILRGDLFEKREFSNQEAK